MSNLNYSENLIFRVPLEKMLNPCISTPLAREPSPPHQIQKRYSQI